MKSFSLDEEEPIKKWRMVVNICVGGVIGLVGLIMLVWTINHRPISDAMDVVQRKGVSTFSPFVFYRFLLIDLILLGFAAFTIIRNVRKMKWAKQRGHW